jgi:hypothetical protein
MVTTVGYKAVRCAVSMGSHRVTEKGGGRWGGVTVVTDQ